MAYDEAGPSAIEDNIRVALHPRRVSTMTTFVLTQKNLSEIPVGISRIEPGCEVETVRFFTLAQRDGGIRIQIQATAAEWKKHAVGAEFRLMPL